ncbi:uncharacterized protein [Rutidosis leptorrhynchoides]|uniref:uncharacterized protein n=1 Tax=Rutidosis leptorrhynchoides TaxID=125765 RepID=UPI003A99218F
MAWMNSCHFAIRIEEPDGEKLPSHLNLLARGLKLNDIRCLLCSYRVESLNHTLFSCEIALEIWSMVRIWVDIPIPFFENWLEWLSWHQGWTGSSRQKMRLYAIVATLSWILWRYRNAFLFDPGKMKKQELYDLIRLYSYNWCKDRGKDCISWTDWLIKPL